jgi:hypothetical protein
LPAGFLPLDALALAEVAAEVAQIVQLGRLG